MSSRASAGGWVNIGRAGAESVGAGGGVMSLNGALSTSRNVASWTCLSACHGVGVQSTAKCGA